MNQWCRSALCGHPLLALTDNLTHGAASRHTIAMPKSATLGLFPVAVATILISRPAEGRWLSWPEHTVEVEVEMDLYSASSLPLPVYVALISVQLGLSQTPANTARPRIRPNVSRGVPVYSPAFAGTQRYKVIVTMELERRIGTLRDAMQARPIPSSGVCLSVTFVDSVKTSNRIVSSIFFSLLSI